MIGGLDISVPIIGADENGWGTIAGPLVVTSVVGLTAEVVCADSKRYPRKKLPHAASKAQESLTAVVSLTASPKDMAVRGDEATRRWLFRRAIGAVRYRSRPAFPVAAIDGSDRFGIPCSIAIKSGDCINSIIAAASVLGKLRQIREMRKLDTKFPEYGFAKHCGYCTEEHTAAIVKYGMIPGVHRVRRCLNWARRRGYHIQFNPNFNPNKDASV